MQYAPPQNNHTKLSATNEDGYRGQRGGFSSLTRRVLVYFAPTKLAKTENISKIIT